MREWEHITKRKEAEEALRKSEVKYAKVFHSNPHSITISALPSGRLVEVNDHFLDVMGYRREDVIGQTPVALNLWVDPAKRARIIKLVQEQGMVRNEEIELRLGPNRVVTCLMSAERIDLGGEPCMVAITRNITERKQIEETLRQSEERLKVVFEYAPDAYYLNDLKGVFVDGNRAAEALTGYKREELIGKSFLRVNLLPPQQIPKAMALLARNALGKSTGPDEFILKRKDGARVPVEIRTYPVKIQGQTLVLGIARDATERKQDEATLREQEERFRTLFDNSPDAIFVEDLDGYVLDVNPAACRLHHTRRERLIGQHIKELVPPEQRPHVMEEFNRLSGDEADYIEGYSWTKNGHAVPVEIRANQIAYAGKPAILLHVRSVTKRKQAEEEVKRLKNFYEQVLNAMPAQLAVFDPEARYLYVNPSGVRDPEMRKWLIGKTDEDYCRKRGFDPAIGRRRVEMLRQVARGKTDLQFEEPFRGRSGEREHFMRFVSPVLDPEGNTVQVLGYGLDITMRKRAEEELQRYRDHLEELVEKRTTELQQINQQLRQEIAERERVETELKREIAERKEAEAALQQSEERFRTLVEHAPEVIMVSDITRGHFVHCNSNAEALFGLSREQLLQTSGPL